MATETLTKSVLTAVGFITGLLSLLILRELEKEDVSMARIQLSPDKALMDFKIISFANAIMLVGFLMYIAGVIFENDSLWIVSKATGGIFGLIYAGVLFRWWKRF